MITKRNNYKSITKIKDRIMINNFSYPISKEDKDFIKLNKGNEDLAIKYIIYKIFRNTKNREALVSYEDFKKIYSKSLKVKRFKDLERYTNSLFNEKVYSSLYLYFNYLKEDTKIGLSIMFKNSVSPKQKISFKFKDRNRDYIVIENITELSTIKGYNPDFEYNIGDEYPYTEFVYELINHRFYPNETTIFEDSRNINMDYYDACTILYDTKDVEYII